MDKIVDTRDQQFVLYEMLKIQDDLLGKGPYEEIDKDTTDMVLDLIKNICEEEGMPTYEEGDRTGAKLIDGSVKAPECYHPLFKVMTESGLFTMGIPTEAGGQGFPYVVDSAGREFYAYNMGFLLYPEAAIGAGHLVEEYGTEEQKKKYARPVFEGRYGGTMVLTEPEAGSDVGALKTKAVKQPDGSYKIFGSKIFISGGDSDLFENIVHPVLARIEGDPAGTKGISIFIVPKYLVNDDGSLGERNDYSITGIEHKMGIKGSATCSMSFGDNGNCYAELLGEERSGMKIMFNMMNGARILMGVQGSSTSSIAYLTALEYAKERIQGKNIKDMMNPDAPDTTIINHPDVRRMLIWMKSQTEAMRALYCYCCACMDRAIVTGDDKWQLLADLLLPVTKAYNTDQAFKVTEQAIQCFGGYGFCQDYPVEQYMRDMKIASLYEGTNGIQSLDLVGRKLGMKKGSVFMSLLGEMNSTIEQYKGNAKLTDMATQTKAAIDMLAGMAMYFAQCGKENKFMVPITNAKPFMNLTGNVVFAWLLFWQAGIAQEALEKIFADNSIDASDSKAVRAFVADNKEAAFYQGKVYSAQYYINNVLPEADAIATAIKKEDMSLMKIQDASFACGEN